MHPSSLPSSIPNLAIAAPPAPRNKGAIWTLILLAPVIAEVFSGSTRVSFIYVLIPEIMVWGCGALLCREMVRRWRAGTPSLLLMGLALSIAEEFIIQQTSIAPLPFPGANADFGRYIGVNWVYLLFMLGFESVWVVLVPVQITELLFPARKQQPWLRKRGLIATCVVFLVGCRIAWFGWTQVARTSKLHAPAYHPPLAAIASGLAAIGLLVWSAYLIRAFGHSGRVDSRRPANHWIMGITAFLMGAGWFEIITLVFVPHPGLHFWVPMTCGTAWALLAFMLFSRWSSALAWNDTHRWAISFGATLGCMFPTYLSTAGWSRLDLIGKVILNALAVASLLALAPRVWRRTGTSQESIARAA